MIKIIFFDVDGTLLRMGEKNISDKTLYALKALKKKGILLCMATGRSYPEIPHFDGVDFDILSTFNGSYIVRDEDVIYKNPLNNTDKNMLIQNLKKMNRAIAISNENIIVANGTDPDLEQYFLFGNVELIISDKFDEISKGEIYQVMCSGTCGEYDTILKGCRNSQITAWWDKAVDIIPLNGGKGNAVNVIPISQLKFLYPLKTLAFTAFSPLRFGPFPSFFPLREEMRETFFRLSLQPYPAALRKFAWPLWWRGRKCSSWYLHQNVPAAPAHPWVLPRGREGWSYMYASTDGSENHPYPRSSFGSIGTHC